MPSYPSNFNDSSIDRNNVTDYRVLQDEVVTDPTPIGKYPTDAAVGRASLDVTTDTLRDGVGQSYSALTKLTTEITNYTTVMNALIADGGSEAAFAANLLSPKIIQITHAALKLSFLLKRLTATANVEQEGGPRPKSPYPSGWNRGY